MKYIRAVWIAFLISIIIYAVKVPFFTEIALYQIIYPILFVVFLMIICKKGNLQVFAHNPLIKTIICWFIISTIGVLLSVANNNLITDYAVDVKLLDDSWKRVAEQHLDFWKSHK